MSQSKDFINFLRSRIDPQAHREQVQKHIDELMRRASAILIDRALAEDSPNLSEDVRKAQIAQMDGMLEELAWRIEQLENDLAGLSTAERNVTGLNRAARRQAEKAEKKAARNVRIVQPPEAEDEGPEAGA